MGRAETDAAAPDGTAPDGTAPDGTAPDGTAPDGPAPDGPAPDGPAPDAGRRAAVTATLIALPIALAVGVLAFWLLGGFRTVATGPVAVQAPPSADPTTASACARLLGTLPVTLDGRAARPVSDAPGQVVAWGDPAVVLRCGVPPPPEPRGDTQVFDVNGVGWVTGERDGAVLWTTVSLPVAVEVALPTGVPGQAVIADVSTAARDTLTSG